MARVQADVEAGRLWKARDRLAGAVATRADDELLDRLGEVHFAMGDLPAAGAMWFVTGRAGEDAAAAVAAWRERSGHDPLAMWSTLPPKVRARPGFLICALVGAVTIVRSVL